MMAELVNAAGHIAWVSVDVWQSKPIIGSNPIHITLSVEGNYMKMPEKGKITDLSQEIWDEILDNLNIIKEKELLDNIIEKTIDFNDGTIICFLDKSNIMFIKYLKQQEKVMVANIPIDLKKLWQEK